LSCPAHADTVFNADFEAGSVAADTGTLRLRYHPFRQVDQTASTDATLGNNILLVDQEA
jgi:hypothetical protein